MSHQLSDLFQPLAKQGDPNRRWSALTEGLATLGFDQINYAFLDFATFGRMEARGDPAMSTMRRDWIDHYTERRYDLADEIVGHVRAGRYDPKFFRLSRSDHFSQRAMAEEARDAGLQAGLLIPLPGPWRDPLPAAGIVIGSSLREDDAARIMRDHAPTLVALAHVLHVGMSGELLRRRSSVTPLSGRERDCLQLTANGMRTAQIADRLMIADVTVALHLRNVRTKLRARNMPEAVAKGLLYGQIDPA